MARPRLSLGQLGNIRVHKVQVANGSQRYEATAWLRRMDGKKVVIQAVSYTHLTLPTSYSV